MAEAASEVEEGSNERVGDARVVYPVVAAGTDCNECLVRF